MANLNPRSAQLRNLPLRLATGAFILNSGIGKLKLDEQGAAALQSMAANAAPLVGALSPRRFGRALAGAEISVGAALLAPFVPPAVAGAALTAFSGGLLVMYARTPSMHQPGSPRPSASGGPFAKDVWMLGSGLSLLIDGLGGPRDG